MKVARRLWAIRTVGYHVAYNALTALFPRASAALQRVTRDTGRGKGRDGAEAAAYFEAVMRDYAVIARAAGVAGPLWRGKHVLELGPGDTRATALLARLEGAARWEGYDPFDIQSRRPGYLGAIYDPILRGRGETQSADELLVGCRVTTTPRSLRGAGPRFDVVVSRAVLEHVRDLRALFDLAASVARPDAVWIHKIDLRDHGIRHDDDLDFLGFSEGVWRAMSSAIDLPNRLRARSYLELGEAAGLRTVWARATHVAEAARVDERRDSLAPPFRRLATDELRVLGLWLVQVGPSHPLRARPSWPLPAAPHAELSRY